MILHQTAKKQIKNIFKTKLLTFKNIIVLVRLTFLLTLISSVFSSNAQMLTKEDSLSAGLIASDNATVISGYGNFLYSNNFTMKEAIANVDRMVLFVGHKFNKRILLFSEIEFEDAGVKEGSATGSVSLEQLFFKFNLDANNYLTTGLFIPRIGISNENHLPTTINGADRPYVEQNIIPTVWREIGVGYYGTTDRIPGLNYSLALITGLNSAGFTNGTGISDGRFSGNASSNALALTGALLYYRGNFRTQISGYFGGSAGVPSYIADSLYLESGTFGSPVKIIEANAQYVGDKFSAKILATSVAISEARAINRAYANNTPEQMMGAYVDIAYTLWKQEQKDLKIFARYEYLDMNYKIPNNGVFNGINNQQYIVAGLSFKPAHGVIIKADYIYRQTDNINPALIITPYPIARPYYKTQHLLNLGIGYSF